MSQAELREAIVSVCLNWASLEDIATAIERNADYLLNEMIPAILEEGLIVCMYPDRPRHPDQKYKKKMMNNPRFVISIS